MERAAVEEWEVERAVATARDPVADLPPRVGEERRLHARAYRLWTILRGGGGAPSLDAFRAADRATFGAHGVLLSAGDGTIGLVGASIAAEAGLAEGAPLAGFTSDTMLAALIQRLGAVVAQRAPVGFEADHPHADGRTLYRGILLPLAGKTGAIDHVYAVIGWRRLAAVAADDVSAAIGQAFAGSPAQALRSPWEAAPRPPLAAPSLAQYLAMARTWAALAHQASPRGESALVWALSATHDLLVAADACPRTLATLGAPTARGGAIARAVRLAFGEEDDPAALRDHCLALVHARRLGLGMGMLAPEIGRHGGFIHGFVADARAKRRPRHDEDRGAPQLRLTPLDPALLAPRPVRRGDQDRIDRAEPAARAFG